MSFRSSLVRGEVVHARDDAHARRTFRYPVYVAAIDLDELPALDRGLRLFAHDRRNLFALHDRDYQLGLVPGELRASLAALLAANGLPAPATTRLVTNLRVAGYVFNPVSFFLNYDARGALESVIAEVNNTYGGSTRYVLGPNERVRADRTAPPYGGAAGRGQAPTVDAGADPARAEFHHVRELFVSPFLHGAARYEFAFDAPLAGDHLEITMNVRDAAGARIFFARLAGTGRPLSDRALLAAAIRYPLMTVQVIGLIHWQALKLRMLGAPYRRPGADHRPHPQT